MARPGKLSTLLVAAGFALCPASSQQPIPKAADQGLEDAEVFHGTLATLRDHPIQVGSLLLSIAPGYTVAGTPNSFDIRVQNTSAQSIVFNPLDLLFVNSEGQQVDYMLLESQPNYRIAPNAYLKKTYILTNLKGPFKIYFIDKLIAYINL